MAISTKEVIKTDTGSYDIDIQPGLLADIGQALRSLTPVKRVAIITDSHVQPLYASALRQSLLVADFQMIEAVLPAGETYKTLQHLIPIYDKLLTAGMERSTPILALGGGVVGDMAGFVAATILRGVPFVQIPTTLLSMVDASVGGKTGVDHTVGKNLIGAFHQPIAVFIDPQTLHTLPPREMRNGLAECIKHDLIRDAAGFEKLRQDLPAILEQDIAVFTDLIAHNVAIKARVVEADPFEKGDRAHLNFGHTFGHAVESVSNYAYAHGEAIALGMTAASYVSAKLGFIDETARATIADTLLRAGLPTRGLTVDPQQVIQAMQFDKKVKDGRIQFVLLERIGRAIIRDDVPADLVAEAVMHLR